MSLPKRNGLNHAFEGFEYVEESEGISAYVLKSNGMQVLLHPMDLAPVAAFMVTYRVGSRNESMGETGATHFLEHLMFKGTDRFNSEKGTSIFSVLQRVGARVNATTWLDRTNYYELLPEENLELAIEIESDRMRNARLGSEDVDSERIVILNEFDRGENNAIRKLYHSVWSAAFTAHPYRHPTIGWRSDIESLSASQLRTFYDTYYWPNNATVSLIGKFDPVDAMELIRLHFEPISQAPEPIPKVTTVEPIQRGPRSTTIRMAGELGALIIAYKAPVADDQDSPALSILSMILGSGKTSRLYRSLVDTGLASSASAGPSLHLDPGLFHVIAMLGLSTDHSEVECVILEELSRLVTESVTDAELERAKAKLRAEVAFSRDGAFSVAAQLNEAIASGDWKLYTQFLDKADAVSVEDVQRVAGRVFRDEIRTIGYFEPILANQENEPMP